MKLRNIKTMLLSGALCLSLIACGSDKTAATSSSTADGAASNTSAGVEIDDPGNVVLINAYTKWVQGPAPSGDPDANAIILSEGNANISGQDYKLEITSYSNSADEYYEFNMQAMPDEDGICYMLYIMYMPDDGDYSADEFYMFVNQMECKNGQIVDASGNPEDTDQDTEGDSTDKGQGSDEEMNAMIYVTLEAYDKQLKEMEESETLIPPEDDSLYDAEVTETEVFYYILDEIIYSDDSVKNADEIEDTYAFSVKPAYPEYVMGMKGGFPNAFTIKEEGSGKSIAMSIAKDGDSENAEEVFCPVTITEDEMVIDMRKSGTDMKVINLKRVSEEEFYTGDTEIFKGMFE